ALLDPLRDRLEQVEGASELEHGRRLAARDDQAVARVELGHPSYAGRGDAQRLEHAEVLTHVALQGEDSAVRSHPNRRAPYQPRSARRCGCGISSTLMPTMASPSPRDTFAITSGSSGKVVAFTIAAARWAGLPDLKMPEPTNTPSAPSCIIIAASAGVAMPPAVNSTTGSLPAASTSATRSYGARSSLSAAYSSAPDSVDSRRISDRIERMCRV